MEMNIILAAPPEMGPAAAKQGVCVAHMAYRIGQGLHLYRSEQFSGRCQGDVMVVDDIGFSGRGDPNTLVSEILAERTARSLSGIVLSFENSTDALLQRAAELLCRAAQQPGIPIYLPSALRDKTGSGIALVTTALSGGTLRQHLSDAIQQYGADSIAVEIERTRMDFLLPAKGGEGQSLSAEELQERIRRYRRQAFFSRDLCAYYFTYRDRFGTHFVLYDNGASIRQKLLAARRSGIGTAFLYYPEVSDILPELLR